jgi:hypothetical protein
MWATQIQQTLFLGKRTDHNHILTKETISHDGKKNFLIVFS